jgi:hypothetical protein
MYNDDDKDQIYLQHGPNQDEARANPKEEKKNSNDDDDDDDDNDDSGDDDDIGSRDVDGDDVSDDTVYSFSSPLSYAIVVVPFPVMANYWVHCHDPSPALS